MPVHVLVSHVPGIDADLLQTLLTIVRKVLLVTPDTRGLVVRQNVFLAREDLLTVPAAEVVAVPVFG